MLMWPFDLPMASGCAAQSRGPEGTRAETEVLASRGERGCQCLRGGAFS